MGSSLLVLSMLLLSPLPDRDLEPAPEKACLCTQSASLPPCGPERTTCHCVSSPGWTLVRFWASDTARCEELVFFLLDGQTEATRAP
jgi:hypothetical protein